MGITQKASAVGGCFYHILLIEALVNTQGEIMDDIHNTFKKANDALQYAMECRAALHGKALDAKAQNALLSLTLLRQDLERLISSKKNIES